MKSGDYVIMNTTDGPEATMVAILTRHDDKRGIWHAHYLWVHRIMREPYGPSPTPLSAFGMAVEIKGRLFRVVDTGQPCTATYEDGVLRRWQDLTGTAWRKIHPDTMKWIASRPKVTNE